MVLRNIKYAKNIRSGRNWHQLHVVLLILALCVLAGCMANLLPENQSISGVKMVEVNQLYESGVYDLAAQNYQMLIDAGIDDGAVYYNLGNAYFKLGDLGRAILNYKRAERLLPRDQDVDANLQLARAQTRDRLEQDGSGLVDFVENLLVGWSTVDEVASVAFILWVLLCGIAIMALLWRRQRTKLSWVLVFLFRKVILFPAFLGKVMNRP